MINIAQAVANTETFQQWKKLSAATFGAGYVQSAKREKMKVRTRQKVEPNRLETEILNLCETGATLTQLTAEIMLSYSVIGKTVRRLVDEERLQKFGTRDSIYRTPRKEPAIPAHDPFGIAHRNLSPQQRAHHINQNNQQPTR
jgi:predicted transcriptional regulator